MDGEDERRLLALVHYAVRMRWLEKEAADNAERARRISRYLPWRNSEKDYGI